MKTQMLKSEPSSLIIDAACDMELLRVIEAIIDRLHVSSFGGPDSGAWKRVREMADSARAVAVIVQEVQRDELRSLLSVRPRACAVPGYSANDLQLGAQMILEMGKGLKLTEPEAERTIARIMAPALATALDSLLSDSSETNELAVCKRVADALREAAKHKKA